MARREPRAAFEAAEDRFIPAEEEPFEFVVSDMPPQRAPKVGQCL
jgi:hypothetical protein